VETKSNKSAKRSSERGSMLPIMSMSELAKLGGGKVVHIKMMTSDEAKEMFPAIEGLLVEINLFALHAVDSTPLAHSPTAIRQPRATPSATSWKSPACTYVHA
jgi:hypothetical protein